MSRHFLLLDRWLRSLTLWQTIFLLAVTFVLSCLLLRYLA